MLSPAIYSLHIELLGIQPTIWREIRVDGEARLSDLHQIIQAVMGWESSQFHKFEIHTNHYGTADQTTDDSEWEIHDEKDFRLNQLLHAGETFLYLYDFGAEWKHLIRVDNVQPIEEDDFGRGEVWVDGGERACPPECADGVPAYQNILDKFENAPYGDEILGHQEWLGTDFDPDRFDRPAANAAVARLLYNGWIQIGS